jgi:hypothetical protein
VMSAALATRNPSGTLSDCTKPPCDWIALPG